MKRNIETFLGCDKEFKDARIVIFGAPFDSTTSYRPGTRFASRTMRAESYGLETYSPYQGLDMEDAAKPKSQWAGGYADRTVERYREGIIFYGTMVYGKAY